MSQCVQYVYRVGWGGVHSHPGASPKTLVRTERGSREDEPVVPPFVCLDQGCSATSGTGSAPERGERKRTFGRVKTVLQGQKTRKDESFLKEVGPGRLDETNRPLMSNKVNRSSAVDSLNSDPESCWRRALLEVCESFRCYLAESKSRKIVFLLLITSSL